MKKSTPVHTVESLRWISLAKGCLLLAMSAMPAGGQHMKAKEDPVVVVNGHIIADGRYLAPPYTIIGRPDGVLVNGNLVRKHSSRREHYRTLRENRIQKEILTEYLEVSEKLGGPDGRKELKERLRSKKTIADIRISSVSVSSVNAVTVHSEQGDTFVVELAENPDMPTRQFMLLGLLGKKYRSWLDAPEELKSTYRQYLDNLLTKKKAQGVLADYIFDGTKLMYKLSGHRLWGKFSKESSRSAILPSNPEADSLDSTDLAREVDVLVTALNHGYLEVFSRGRHRAAVPQGDSVISRLRGVMADSSLDPLERRRRVREVYRPGDSDGALLDDVLMNFGK